MKKGILILAVICIVFTLFIILINLESKTSAVDKKQEREQLYRSISTEISRCQSGEISEVDISNITPFFWERMYVFAPYSSEREINETLGIHWSGSKSTYIDTSDSIALIVFTDEDAVVQYLDFSRGPWDFAYLENEEGYGVDEARFTVDNTGRMHWVFE